MMKGLLSIALVLFFASITHASDSTNTKLYNPSANASKDIKNAIAKANKEGKHVLIQAGGNWCSWCMRFNKFVIEDIQLDSTIRANYVVYHLNYDRKDNTANDAVYAKYGYPQRFGFPVFVVLDGKGNRIHTQNSSYLEEGKGYSKEKVLEFLKAWNAEAVSPVSYSK